MRPESPFCSHVKDEVPDPSPLAGCSSVCSPLNCRHKKTAKQRFPREGANKQVISSQADSLIKISRIWADFFPANTSNQPI